MATQHSSIAAALVLVFVGNARPWAQPIAGFARVRTQTVAATHAQSWGANKPYTSAPAALQLFAQFLDRWSTGLLMVRDHDVLSDVRFDRDRDALVADIRPTVTTVPKVFIERTSGTSHVIIGSFRGGFGRGLVFSSLATARPNGFVPDFRVDSPSHTVRACRESVGELAISPCPASSPRRYRVANYRARPSQRGGAFTIGGPVVTWHGFISHQPQSIYQYAIYDAARCSNPRNNDDSDCRSPRVFRHRREPTQPTSAISWSTLPRAFVETMAGTHASFRPVPNVRLGVTGFASSISWHIDEMKLDFQEWHRFPFGGPFGAAGIDGDVVGRESSTTFEVARVFHSMGPGGGGWAVFTEQALAVGTGELRTSFRYYGPSYANPHARAAAQSDRVEGNRARDEVGVRATISGELTSRVRWNTWVDVWRAVSRRPWTLPSLSHHASAGLEWSISPRLVTTTSVDHRRRCTLGALASDNDPTTCARARSITSSIGVGQNDPIGLRAHIRYSTSNPLTGPPIAGNLGLTTERHQYSGSLVLRLQPHQRLDVRGRARLFDDYAGDAERGERSLFLSSRVTLRVRDRDHIAATTTYRRFLDRRASTLLRQPNPELWFGLDLKHHF